MLRLANRLLVTAIFIMTLATGGNALCNSVADVIFALRASPQTERVPFQQQKDFLSDVSRGLLIAENKFRVGAIMYSDIGIAIFKLSLYNSNEPVAQRLKIMNQPPKTNRVLPDLALKKISEISMFGPMQGGRVYVNRVLVLLLDDRAQNLQATIAEANVLKQRGIRIIAIGIGNVQQAILQQIASNELNVFTTQSSALLHNSKDRVIQRICEIAQFVPPINIEKCNGLVDFVFALDTSGSITSSDYYKELNFADTMMKSFVIGENSAKFSTLIFSTSVQLLFKLNQYLSQDGLTEALRNAPYLQGGTNTDQALSFILQQQLFSFANGGRPNAKDVVIVLTDGQSNDMRKTISMADRLKAIGITMISVGVGAANLQELQSMASSSDLVFTFKDFDELAQKSRAVQHAMCQASKPEAYPKPPIAETPPATRAPPAEATPRPCPALADIGFLIDSSGSLGLENYHKEQQFAVDIAKRFPIGARGARFACVIFSATAELIFDFAQNLDQATLERTMFALPYHNYTTHTDKALDLIYNDNMFSAENGGRDNAAKILIILTDGNSDDPAKTAEAARRIKAKGVSIICVGIGDILMSELRAVASDEKNVFTAASFAAINQITKEVAERACQVPSEGRRYQVSNDK